MNNKFQEEGIKAQAFVDVNFVVKTVIIGYSSDIRY